jgi:glutaredoxin 3
MTGQKTVPSIFIAGKHIGGNAEVQALANTGELRNLLDNAGIANDF